MASASDPARIRSFFWKPSETLREHSHRDFGSGDLRYVQWVTERHLPTSRGRSIDPAVIATFTANLYRRYNVLGLAYDRWRCDELLREFDRIGLAAYKDDDDNGQGLRLIPWGQGFRDMGRCYRCARARRHRAQARARKLPSAELEYFKCRRRDRSRWQSKVGQGQGDISHRRRRRVGDVSWLACA
jgi:hypothetical protein